MAQKYYVFSGLGADERVFKNLSFGEAEVEHIQSNGYRLWLLKRLLNTPSASLSELRILILCL